MASNSFAMKAFAGTITAAVIAYAGAAQNPAPLLAVAGILPVSVFWIMDARYLRLEKLFRKLYDGVRSGEVTEPFDMNFMRYDGDVDHLVRVGTAWSARLFYLPLVVILAILALVI